ncbi:MAG: phage holin family protein [bacterium]|nr:phage holin family protein [bacterium]
MISWLLTILAVIVTAYILPGVMLSGFAAAFVTALVLGVINTFIKPLLVFLTLPITILTLGLFTFVINAVLVLLASYVVPGFEVRNFWWALLFALVLSLVRYVLHKFAV